MNLAEFAVVNKVLIVLLIFLALAGGWSAYQHMARFEDPEFTIRVAQIVTQYPGASPLEVAEEVTEPLERAIRQLQEVDVIESVSSAGVSEIKVEIKYAFSRSKPALQVIWAKLRDKVGDAERALPPDVQHPAVFDDFGDVYGLYYFLTGEGYAPAELRRYAKDLQDEFLQVEGVAKVRLGGARREAIFVEIAQDTAVALGVSIRNVYDDLARQNAVVSAGDVAIGDQRLVIDPSGAIDSVEAIENLLVSTSADGGILYLKDIARVWRGYQTPPATLFRHDGQPAIAMGVSMVPGSNVVDIGRAVDDKIAESESRRPVGIELHEYYHQGKVVDASVRNFLLNVVAAFVIVVVTLLLFMGLRSAAIIGAILMLTIFATLTAMNAVGIPMHRISLGALIIALGMMVDNAIVVTEGILVGVRRGERTLDVAKTVVTQTQWPLLGGTLVGIIAFGPIGFAPGDTAEYTGHLFWVMLIALLFSWVLAVTVTPLLCHWLFRGAPAAASGGKQGDHVLLRIYKAVLRRALGMRLVVVGGAVGLFVLSLWGAQFVKSGFFPTSTTPQIVVDYWLPQGTDIVRTQREIQAVEAFVADLEGVNAVQTSIGAGGLRYMLIYSGESPNPSYAQILARVDDYRVIDGLMPRIQGYIDEHYPDAQAKIWRFVLGPGGGSKIEATFKGPDPVVLRRLAGEAKAVMVADGRALFIKDDWRQPVSVIEPVYSERKARRAGVSRKDLALALRTGFSGDTVGVYREGDDLLPIIARAPALERVSVEDMRNIQVLSSATGRTVSIGQVTDGFRTTWRDGLLRRENGVWTIKAQSDPVPGELASELLARIQPAVEAIALPDGYTLEWDGEYGDSKESSDNLASTLPFGLLAMVFTVFALFGTVRQPVVIWLVVPLAWIGVVAGLVVTQLPLEFMGILGVLSLSGLLIKNAIVLVDQIDLEIKGDTSRYDAVVNAAASRVRPVMMGALTTVLGVIPLFFDAFFQSMSVVLVAGLSFATLLTLVIVPVLYAMFFSIRREATAATGGLP